MRSPLQPGQLQGNHFTVLLRELPLAMQDIFKAVVAEVHTVGFVNYYGSQRFGDEKFEIQSYEIGRIRQAELAAFYDNKKPLNKSF